MTRTATRILGMGCWKCRKAGRHSSGWWGTTGITRTEILLFMTETECRYRSSFESVRKECMQDEVYRDFIRYGCSCINRIVGFGMDNLWDDYLDKHCERKHRIQDRQMEREREAMKEWERINDGETDN